MTENPEFTADQTNRDFELMTAIVLYPYRRVIIRTVSGYSGVWGVGVTLDEAFRNTRKAGGKVRDMERHMSVSLLLSHLPFAPDDREARDGEAEAYVSTDGALVWDRCVKIDI